METSEVAVRGPQKRHWTTEQKLAIVQEWRNGLPAEEVARKYGVSYSRIYVWRKKLEKSLSDHGELVPKSQIGTLNKKIEELERALGRKAMEVDILKKFFETKGLKLPEGM